jgi:hypothetical protein
MNKRLSPKWEAAEQQPHGWWRRNAVGRARTGSRFLSALLALLGMFAILVVLVSVSAPHLDRQAVAAVPYFHENAQ